MSFLIPIGDGFEETEAITVVDLLRRAGIDIIVASVKDNELKVTGSHEIEITADVLLSNIEPEKLEGLILPGGPGVKELKRNMALLDLVRTNFSEEKLTAAICAAPTILAASGICAGKRMACFPAVEEELRGNGIEVLREEVVEDGRIITSRGVGTAIPFALALIEAIKSKEVAEEIANSIVFHQGTNQDD